jgi:hypothetical protein
VEYLRTFVYYVNENQSDDFKKGDIVFVNGIIDGRKFNNVRGVIVEINPIGRDRTNIDENGDEVELYQYHGITYRIDFLHLNKQWWCPLYNLSKTEEKKDKQPGKIRWYSKGKFED